MGGVYSLLWGKGEDEKVVLRILSLPPDPAEGVGEELAAFLDAVTAFGGDEFVIVFGEGEGFGHLLVGEPPIAVGIIEVLATVLKPDAKGSLILLPNERRISVTSPNVGEAADVADDLAEEVGPLPGDGEGTDPSGTGSTDYALVWVRGEVEFFGHFGEKFGFKHTRISIVERIIFETAVAGSCLFPGRPVLTTFNFFVENSGVNEDADGDGNLTSMDEIIECNGGSALASFVDVGVAVLKDHDSSGFRGFVLVGNVKIVLTQRALKDLTAVLVSRDLTYGDTLLALGIFGEPVIAEERRASEKDKCQNKKLHGIKITWRKLGIYRVMMALHISKRMATPSKGSGHQTGETVGMRI